MKKEKLKAAGRFIDKVTGKTPKGFVIFALSYIVVMVALWVFLAWFFIVRFL